MPMKVGLILVLACAVPIAALASGEVIRDPGAWDFAPLLYYDRIISGTVHSASVTEISAADLSMYPPELRAKIGDPKITVVRVAFQVREVLRGPSAPGQQEFLAVGDVGQALDAYKSGAELLVCMKYHPLLTTYYQGSSYGVYRREGGAWKSLNTARGERSFGDLEIREKISSMDLKSVVAEAELIVDGEIENVDTTTVLGPDKSSAEMLTLTIRIRSVKKGAFPNDVIQVKGITRGMYLPTWRKHMPHSMVAGQRWLCFLKKNELGWYPFAGANGLLRESDGSYIYDERVQFWYSRDKVVKAISDVEGQRQ